MTYLLLSRFGQLPRMFFVLGAVMLLVSTNITPKAQAQRKRGAQAEEDTPAFHEYRGVQLGMTAEGVRKKLGTPKDKSDEQDFFVFNDNETAQILYDKSHQVITISADFTSGGEGIPTAKQVFGADVQAKPDGSIYKMVRYPKAGYWLSYNRTAGNAPLTSVTLQKIE